MTAASAVAGSPSQGCVQAPSPTAWRNVLRSPVFGSKTRWKMIVTTISDMTTGTKKSVRKSDRATSRRFSRRASRKPRATSSGVRTATKTREFQVARQKTSSPASAR
jgi:hypothetical protein